MKQTPARTRFKEHFGQANHFVVTSVVALHTLEHSGLLAAPPELHTVWNPKSRKATLDRTRTFLLHAALNTAVDSVDMYISLLYRKPNYLRNQVVCSALDAAGRSVGAKIAVIKQHYAPPAPETALLELLVTWRNNTIHELGDNRVEPDTRATIVKHADYIAETFRGLRVDGLADKAEAGAPLTFKETTSLISAAHRFVQEVDATVVARLDLEKLCRELIADAVVDPDPDQKTFSLKYFSLPESARASCVANWLATNYGITSIPEAKLAASLRITRPGAAQ